MPTIRQLTRHCKRQKKKKINKTPVLKGCPQKKAIVVRAYNRTPKKPNSALRKVVKVKLKNRRMIESYIPGEGHTLQEFAVVLLRGGRVPDVPGVKYHTIRGKYDLRGVVKRKTSRSKYGRKNIDIERDTI